MKLFQGIKQLLGHIRMIMSPRPQYPNVHPTAHLSLDAKVTSPEYLYMEEDTSIPSGAVIMNGRTGKFVMKKWSFSSIDLLIICGNHMPVIGMPLIKVTNEIKLKLDTNHKYSKDVIVEEDVWLGARVTLLPGVHVGRGAIVATGAVVSKSIPPYSVWGGVPARLLKWKWTVEEILSHEEQLYDQGDRFTKEELVSFRTKYE